jgi:hypothetical protein
MEREIEGQKAQNGRKPWVSPGSLALIVGGMILSQFIQGFGVLLHHGPDVAGGRRAQAPARPLTGARRRRLPGTGHNGALQENRWRLHGSCRNECKARLTGLVSRQTRLARSL